MKIGAMQDYLGDLRDTASVLESYAQLATFSSDKDVTTIQQAGAFMFMVYQQQISILQSMELLLKEYEKSMKT